MPTSLDLQRDYNDYYTYGINSWQSCHTEMNTDIEYYLGRQFTDSELSDLSEEGRQAYIYNYCQRNVHLMLGHQMMNRKGLGVQAVEGSDEQTADIFDKLMSSAATNGSFYNVFTDCFEDELITGFGLCSMWIDYKDDIVNGDARIRCDPFQTIMIDPKFTQINLEDCGFILRRNFVNEEELKGLQPSIKVKEFKSGVPDQKFNYMSLSRNNSGQKIYAYDEMWTRSTKKASIVIDRVNGDAKRWLGSDEDLQRKLASNMFLMETKVNMPSVKYTSFVGMEQVYYGDELSGIDDYPFVPFLGVYKPQYENFKYKLHGIIRPTRDPQDNYNKVRSKQDDILRSMLYSSWLVEEGALKNAEDAFKAGTGQVLVLKKGASINSVHQIPHRDLPQGLPYMTEQLGKDILQLPGLNEESLGVAEGGNTDISAKLGQQRASSGAITTQKYYNNLDISMTLVGRKLLRMFQVNYDAEKIKRITDMDPTEEFFDRDFGKYDAVVKRQDLTDTQREHTFSQALQMKQIIGEEFPTSVVIDTMPISGITNVREAYEQQAQQKAEQAKGVQEQEEINKRLINAEIVHKLSLAEQQRETAVSRQALAIQHLANSEADHAKATLDNIKSVKEIENMKQDQLIKVMDFIMTLQEQSRMNAKLDVKETSKQSEEDMMATNQMNKQGQDPAEQAQQMGQLSSLAQPNQGQ